MVQPDLEEKDLLESFERDEWKSVPEREPQIERYREYARATLKKDKRIDSGSSEQGFEASN